MKKHSNQLRIYSICVTVVALLALAAFAAVFHRAGYDAKLLAKLGLRQTPVSTNYAVFSWDNCLQKLGYDADVAFLGDSITRSSDFGAVFTDSKIVNLGYSGDSLAGMTQRVSMVQAVSPEKVFVMGGINGLTDLNLSASLAAYAALLDALQSAVPDASVCVQSVLPIAAALEKSKCHNTTIAKFNDGVAQLAQERQMTYIDLYSLYELDGAMDPSLTSDGIHLYPQAYDRWIEAIRPYME